MDAADEKRAAKEQRKSIRSGAGLLPSFGRKSHEAESTSEPAPGEAPTLAERRESAAPTPIRTSMEDQASIRMREAAAAANGDAVSPLSPVSSGSPSDRNVKNWFKTKFSRRVSKGPKSPGPDQEKETPASDSKNFVGGAALTGASATNSTASLGANSATARDTATTIPAPVAVAPMATELEAGPPLQKSITVDSDPDLESEDDVSHHGSSDQPESASVVTQPESTSSIPGEASRPETTRVAGWSPGHERSGSSSTVTPAAPGAPTSASAPRETSDEEERGRSTSRASDDEEEFQEARDNFDEDLAPPPTFPAEKSSSPARTAKFHEEI